MTVRLEVGCELIRNESRFYLNWKYEGTSTNKGTSLSSGGITQRRGSHYRWVQIGFRCVIGLNFRWVFLLFLFLLTILGVIVYFTVDLVTLKFLRYMYVLSYACAMFCYIYTGTMNPGVIIRDENNAIENGDELEKQEYTYCSTCQLYRPPKANHCKICGVCFYKYPIFCNLSF